MGLLTASFNFRGFVLVDEAQATDFEVCRHSIRTLLAAALMSLADCAAGPCELVVDGDVSASHAVVTVRSRPRSEQPTVGMQPASESGPRLPIDWTEVQALAAAEGCDLSRTPDVVTIRLPRAVITSPLQMAPV